MGGKVYVLVPSFMRYPILDELRRTFECEDGIKVIPMVTTVVNDYSDKEQVKWVVEEIRSSVKNLVNDLVSEDEVYLIVGGSCLGVALAVEELVKNGIDYKKLVFEKRINKYVIME